MDIKECVLKHAGNVCQERFQKLAEGRSLGGKIAEVITFKANAAWKGRCMVYIKIKNSLLEVFQGW